MFTDEVLATAILNRFLHHCEVISINGPSWRLKDKLANPIPPTATAPCETDQQPEPTRQVRSYADTAVIAQRQVDTKSNEITSFTDLLEDLDLLIAAIAELHRLVVLHYDRDFDTVAVAAGQPAAWVAKPGSVG